MRIAPRGQSIGGSMRNSIYLFFIFLIQVSVVHGQSVGQSVSVIGGQGAAQECYRNATMAVQLKMADVRDTERCTYALDYVSMGLRDKAATHINRGVILSAAEQYNEALADYESALSMMDNLGVAYLNRGNIFFITREFDGAIEQYTLALEKDSQRKHIIYLNRGMAYENSGQIIPAYADYTTALELMPEWSAATEKLDRLLRRNPSFDPAG